MHGHLDRRTSNFDSFLRGNMKSIAYEMAVESVHDLFTRLAISAGGVCDLPGIFVRHYFGRASRAAVFIPVFGRNVLGRLMFRFSIYRLSHK